MHNNEKWSKVVGKQHPWDACKYTKTQNSKQSLGEFKNAQGR